MQRQGTYPLASLSPVNLPGYGRPILEEETPSEGSLPGRPILEEETPSEGSLPTFPIQQP